MQAGAAVYELSRLQRLAMGPLEESLEFRNDSPILEQQVISLQNELAHRPAPGGVGAETHRDVDVLLLIGGHTPVDPHPPVHRLSVTRALQPSG